jgi:hypothetical protein
MQQQVALTGHVESDERVVVVVVVGWCRAAVGCCR